MEAAIELNVVRVATFAIQPAPTGDDEGDVNEVVTFKLRTRGLTSRLGDRGASLARPDGRYDALK